MNMNSRDRMLGRIACFIVVGKKYLFRKEI